MRSILVHAERGSAGTARIETGLSLARMSGGHVTLLIDTPVMRYTTIDALGGASVATEALQDAVAEDDTFAQASSARLQREDVPSTVLRAEVEPLEALTTAGRLADVVIVSRADNVAADLAVAVRCPVLAVNDGHILTFPLDRACIAWDGSAEASIALRAAVPLLLGCAAVTVLTIDSTKADWPDLDAVSYLSRHGIAADLQVLPRLGTVEESLAREVKERNSQLLVMGAFGHSRVREFLFGGVTRSFLSYEGAPPLLLSH
ncbi:MAG: hypothetical protein RLZZ136_1173 [Pseudomonadota bacterium]|jgi:nucleotide-binding universal stress UspA family protein